MSGAGFMLAAVLSVLSVIWLHEIGHVIAARLVGIRVHRVRIRPGWASVEMEAPERPLQKIVVGAGGALMNLLSALVLLAVFAAGVGRTHRLPAPVLLEPGGGLAAGTEIRAVDGVPVTSSMDLLLVSAERAGETVTVTTQDGTHEWQVPPREQMPAVVDRTYDLQPPGVVGAVAEGARSLAELVGDAGASARLAAQEGFSALVGPVGAVRMLAAELAAEPLAGIYLLAVFHVSVAVLNLLPLPGLDGYWVLMGAAEAVSRRGIPVERAAVWVWRSIWFWVAFALILIIKDTWLWARGR